jgi:hypothetical protein
MTAHLPPLTEEDMHDVYLSLMAPSTSTAALPSPIEALPAPPQPAALAALHQRLLPSRSHESPGVLAAAMSKLYDPSSSTSIAIRPERRVYECLVALEEALASIEAYREALNLSPRAEEKLPDAGLATRGEWDALVAEAVRRYLPSQDDLTCAQVVSTPPEMVFRILHLMQVCRRIRGDGQLLTQDAAVGRRRRQHRSKADGRTLRRA